MLFAPEEAMLLELREAGIENDYVGDPAEPEAVSATNRPGRAFATEDHRIYIEAYETNVENVGSLLESGEALDGQTLADLLEADARKTQCLVDSARYHAGSFEINLIMAKHASELLATSKKVRAGEVSTKDVEGYAREQVSLLAKSRGKE